MKSFPELDNCFGCLVLISVISVISTIAIPRFKLMQKLTDRLNLVTRESLTGMMVIRAFGNQKHEEERFRKASAELRDNTRFVNRVMNVLAEHDADNESFLPGHYMGRCP